MQTILTILMFICFIIMMFILIKSRKQVIKYKKSYENIKILYEEKEKLIEIENEHKNIYIENLKYHNKEQEKLYYQLLNASKLTK